MLALQVLRVLPCVAVTPLQLAAVLGRLLALLLDQLLLLAVG